MQRELERDFLSPFHTNPPMLCNIYLLLCLNIESDSLYTLYDWLFSNSVLQMCHGFHKNIMQPNLLKGSVYKF